MIEAIFVLAAVVWTAFALVWLEGWWYRRHRTYQETLQDYFGQTAAAVGEQLIPAMRKVGVAMQEATVAFVSFVEAMRKAFAESES